MKGTLTKKSFLMLRSILPNTPISVYISQAIQIIRKNLSEKLTNDIENFKKILFILIIRYHFMHY